MVQHTVKSGLPMYLKQWNTLQNSCQKGLKFTNKKLK